MENSPWAAAEFKGCHQKTVTVTILQKESIVSSQVQTLKLARKQRRTLVPSSQVGGQSRCPDTVSVECPLAPHALNSQKHRPGLRLPGGAQGSRSPRGIPQEDGGEP